MSSKTPKGTWRIKPNDNKSIAIGNVLLSEAFFRRYGLDRVISDLKTKGVDLSKLAELMVAYKRGDNFSIFKAHEFIMEPVIRDRFRLDEFNVKTLYRAVERLGQNRERIVAAFRQRILSEYREQISDVIFDWTLTSPPGQNQDLLSKSGYDVFSTPLV